VQEKVRMYHDRGGGNRVPGPRTLCRNILISEGLCTSEIRPDASGYRNERDFVRATQHVHVYRQEEKAKKEATRRDR